MTNCYFCHRPVDREVSIAIHKCPVDGCGIHTIEHHAHLQCLEAAQACFIDPAELRALPGVRREKGKGASL